MFESYKQNARFTKNIAKKIQAGDYNCRIVIKQHQKLLNAKKMQEKPNSLHCFFNE
jgi:hypothetical protein